MQIGLKRCLLFFVLLAGATGLRAQTVITIKFDDIPQYVAPTEEYSLLGIHFGSGATGVQTGLTNGDPGSWGVDGTNGAYFLGFNGGPAYADIISLDKPVETVSLDVSRTNGSSPTDTFTLTAFAGATQVATQTVTLLTINVWQTVTVSTGSLNITSLKLEGFGGSFHPFGVDNIQFSAVPEPATWALLGTGLMAFAGLRRRR